MISYLFWRTNQKGYETTTTYYHNTFAAHFK